MNVDKTIQAALFHYPTLFQNRTQVLHNLFYVIGNGYEWQDGELVNMFADHDKHAMDHLSYWDKAAAASNSPVDFLDIKHFELRRIQAVHNTLLGRSHCHGPFNLYPDIPGEARIYQIPDDVKDDWRAAAAEIRVITERARLLAVLAKDRAELQGTG